MQHLVFLAQAQCKFKQLGLVLPDQARQGNGGAHVAQRIVGAFVQQAVGTGQIFELEGDAAVFLAWPLDTVRAQRIDHAHHVQQIPAATFVLPLAGIRINEVAPEQKARDFVIKTDGVVTHTHRARLAESSLERACKLVFRYALLQTLLGSNARQQAGLGAG